jgi:hypothetical protein
MSRSDKKLGAKKEAAILALLTSPNIEKAARSVGVTTRTFFRWMKEPAFDEACRAARRAAFGQTVARLQHASGAAASTLLKVMLESGTPPSTQVRAADSVLALTIKAMETDDIEARVAALERAAEEAKAVDRR